MKENNLFIVFEGIDGSGKSSLARMVADRLISEGKKVFLTMEPTSKETGNLIRKFLLGELGSDMESSTKSDVLSLLFAADRKLHIEEIQNKLNEGYYVLCDRYLYSSLAYQNDMEFTQLCNRDYLPADYVVYIESDVNKCLERINNNRDHKEIFEKKKDLERIKYNYDRKIIPYIPSVKVQRINGDNSLQKMFTDLMTSELGKLL